MVLLVLAAVLFGIRTTLILDGCRRRPRRPDLVERLRPFAPTSVADEARDWLTEQI
jgi:hypothetical protein